MCIMAAMGKMISFAAVFMVSLIVVLFTSLRYDDFLSDRKLRNFLLKNTAKRRIFLLFRLKKA